MWSNEQLGTRAARSDSMRSVPWRGQSEQVQRHWLNCCSAFHEAGSRVARNGDRARDRWPPASQPRRSQRRTFYDPDSHYTEPLCHRRFVLGGRKALKDQAATRARRFLAIQCRNNYQKEAPPSGREGVMRVLPSSGFAMSMQHSWRRASDACWQG